MYIYGINNLLGMYFACQKFVFWATDITNMSA